MIYLGWVLFGVLSLYQWVLIVRAVLSWVQAINRTWKPRGVVLIVAEGVYTLTDPLLRPLRKLIKPLRVGPFSLDLAFLALFVLVTVCIQLVVSVFF